VVADLFGRHQTARMPCLVAFLALLAPRVTSVVLWLFTSFFDGALARAGTLIILLGVIFLPFTTLAYAWAINARGSVDGIFIVIMILAVIADLSAFEGGRRRRSA
jgi:hypothetical protein